MEPSLNGDYLGTVGLPGENDFPEKKVVYAFDFDGTLLKENSPAEVARKVWLDKRNPLLKRWGARLACWYAKRSSEKNPNRPPTRKEYIILEKVFAKNIYKSCLEVTKDNIAPNQEIVDEVRELMNDDRNFVAVISSSPKELVDSYLESLGLNVYSVGLKLIDDGNGKISRADNEEFYNKLTRDRSSNVAKTYAVAEIIGSQGPVGKLVCIGNSTADLVHGEVLREALEYYGVPEDFYNNIDIENRHVPIRGRAMVYDGNMDPRQK